MAIINCSCLVQEKIANYFKNLSIKQKFLIVVSCLVVVYKFMEIIAVIVTVIYAADDILHDFVGNESPTDFNLTLSPDNQQDVVGNISEIKTEVSIKGKGNIDPIHLDYDLPSKLGDNDLSVEIPAKELYCPQDLNVKIIVNRNLKNGSYVIGIRGTRKSDKLKRNSTFKLILLQKKSNPPYLLDLTSDMAYYTSPPGLPVTWTAKAKDPENDTIYYNYYLKGPVEDKCYTWVSQLPEDGWSESKTFVWDTENYKPGTYYVGVAVVELDEGNYIKGKMNWFLARIYNLSNETSDETHDIVASINVTHIVDSYANETHDMVAPVNVTHIVDSYANETPNVKTITSPTISIEEFKKQVGNKRINLEKVSLNLGTCDVWIKDPTDKTIKYVHKKATISFRNPYIENCEIKIILDNDKPIDIQATLNSKSVSYIPAYVSKMALQDLSKYYM
jgi:hypothetical protein